MDIKKQDNRFNKDWILISSKFFKFREVNPILAATNCNIPAIFIHGKDDSLVDISHSRDLVKAYAGYYKKFLEVENLGHNAPRPKRIFEEVNMTIKIIKHILFL